MLSLVKYNNEHRTSDGQPLHWGRLFEDGLPFRGQPQLLTNEEADERYVRSGWARNGRFDLTKPEENRKYLEVIDKIANGLYVGRKEITLAATPDQHLVYLEWIELYVIDGGVRGFSPLAY